MHRLSLDEIKLICESLCDDDAACFAQTGERSRDAAFACFPRRGMKIMTEDACWTNVCRIIVQKRFSLRLCDHVHSIARLEWARANGATLIVREGGAEAMARAGHLKVLQLALKTGVVSLDINSASAAAASMGHLSMLQWMHSDPPGASELGVERSARRPRVAIWRCWSAYSPMGACLKIPKLAARWPAPRPGLGN